MIAKKILKLPCWRGLQENHDQLQVTKDFPVIWKFREFGSDKSNFKTTLVRGSYEHPIEQIEETVKAMSNAVSERTKDIIKAKSSYENQQRSQCKLRA